MASRRVADSYGGYRARLVEQLRAKGIRDLAVLRAFGEVPRHLFVSEAFRNQAYEDTSLPLGHGQTISQPSTQARFLEALGLKGTERVLEIGTGSGYQTALLALLAQTVMSIERVAALADAARQQLGAAGARNVSVYHGDGTLGWRPGAPYEAIVVAAVSPSVPPPLLDQLTPDGQLVIPLDRGDRQELVRFVKQGRDVAQQVLGDATFVPLLGRHGYGEGSPRA